jgi:hypothetical protein
MQPHKNMIPNLNLAISGSRNTLPNANTVINLAMLQNTVLSYTSRRLQLTTPLLLRVQISDGSLTLLHRITSPLKYPICTYTLNMKAQMKCSLEMVQVWKSLTQVLLLFPFLNALSKFKTLFVFPPLIKIWFQSIILPNTTMFLEFHPSCFFVKDQQTRERDSSSRTVWEWCLSSTSSLCLHSHCNGSWTHIYKWLASAPRPPFLKSCRQNDLLILSYSFQQFFYISFLWFLFYQ